MRFIIKQLVTIILISFSFNSYSSEAFIYKDLGWKIDIPSTWKQVSSNKVLPIQKRGAAVMKDLTGRSYKSKSYPLNIFIYRNGSNQIDANIKPFTSLGGFSNYLEVFKEVNEVLYQTVKEGTGSKDMTSELTEVNIGGHLFHKYKLVVKSPSGVIMTIIRHSRIFDNKEFNLTMVIVDEKVGLEFIRAWEESTFKLPTKHNG